MEALLIFLAITALQIIAARSKQKKEAEKQRRSAIPQEAAPLPIPEESQEEIYQEEFEQEDFAEEKTVFEPIPEPILESAPEEFKMEGFAPGSMPFQSIADRKSEANKIVLEPEQAAEPASKPIKPRISMDTSNPSQGILWAAILQEPRYKVKWKSKRCYP